ncbi:MAG: hypothetical protein IH596_06670 [Bacteroidales bacterium]|nr:hypothetical protein [Bacteroidales bacterium]
MLFTGLQTFAQQPVVKVSLDTNVMLIGDQVGMQLEFTGAEGMELFWPNLPDTLDKFMVIDRSPIDTLPGQPGTPVTLFQRLLLTTFDSGLYTIPQIPFYYRMPPDTSMRVIESRPHYLAVHTVAVDTTKPIKPIKGPRKAPLTLWEILRWVLIGLAVILLIAFVIYYLKKRKNKEPVFRLRTRVQLQPHEIALQELEKLRIRNLWQQGNLKEYYTGLTDILRRYIEARFAVAALESTSAEILHDLFEKPGVTRENWDVLGQVLMMADMVKFAKEQPGAKKNEESLERGVEFVNQTAIIEAQGTGHRAQEEIGKGGFQTRPSTTAGLVGVGSKPAPR